MRSAISSASSPGSSLARRPGLRHPQAHASACRATAASRFRTGRFSRPSVGELLAILDHRRGPSAHFTHSMRFRRSGQFHSGALVMPSSPFRFHPLPRSLSPRHGSATRGRGSDDAMTLRRDRLLRCLDRAGQPDQVNLASSRINSASHAGDASQGRPSLRSAAVPPLRAHR
jgi:hypothetical protein